APVIAGDLAISVAANQSVVITTADLTEADPDNSGTQLTYTVTGTSHGQVMVNGNAVDTFTQAQLAAGQVSFHQDGTRSTDAGFTVTLKAPLGLTPAPATVTASVSFPGNHAPAVTAPNASATRGQVFQASDLIQASDADGDTFNFTIYDYNNSPDSGHFSVN